jgi:predicted nucleic acid-binding protein
MQVNNHHDDGTVKGPRRGFARSVRATMVERIVVETTIEGHPARRARALDGLGLRTLEADRPLLLLAIDAMALHELIAYDALYIALAQSTGAALATLDRSQGDAAGASGVRVEAADDTRLAEHRPVYAAGDTADAVWLRSAVAGQHIAELRRQLNDERSRA